MKSLGRDRLFATPWTVAYRLLSPWNFSGKSTGVGCHFLLQGIFPTQGSNPGLPQYRQTLYRLSHQGIVSNSLRPHGLQARPGFSVLHYLPGVCSVSCPVKPVIPSNHSFIHSKVFWSTYCVPISILELITNSLPARLGLSAATKSHVILK